MNINLSTNKLTDVVFILGNTKLEKVNEFKYLGVTIDAQLTFQAYKESLIKFEN